MPYADPAKQKAYLAKWYAKNKEKQNAYVTAYHKARLASGDSYQKEYREKNKEYFRERWRAYYRRNRKVLMDKASERGQQRRILKRTRQLMLTAEDRSAILSIYRECKRRTQETGVEHHVDHIVPLKSPRVCGLHVPANLQILTGAENAAKGNRYWPHAPA